LTSFKLRFHELALREWQQLDASVREPFKKKLAERLLTPRVVAAALHGMPDCYKIKLHSVGYRPRRKSRPFSNAPGSGGPSCCKRRAA
jgi:mRNA interferase RelE/StbE